MTRGSTGFLVCFLMLADKGECLVGSVARARRASPQSDFFVILGKNLDLLHTSATASGGCQELYALGRTVPFVEEAEHDALKVRQVLHHVCRELSPGPAVVA